VKGSGGESNLFCFLGGVFDSAAQYPAPALKTRRSQTKREDFIEFQTIIEEMIGTFWETAARLPRGSGAQEW
jgi:hypothetical protein